MTHPIAESKLSPEAAERYSRQIYFFGQEGQELLKSKRILVLGAGGLGSPILYYLTGAGVGELLISDFDVVSLSNLNRQILHNQERLGMNKVESALKTLRAFNPDVKISGYPEKLSASQLLALAKTCDLVIEATDNMENKERINAILAKEKITCIYAILVGMAGFAFLSRQGAPCWNCLFRPAPLFATGRALPFEYYPSFGAAAGLLGSFISNIAVRHLLGFGTPVYDKIFYLSQLLPFKKLQLSSRGIKAIMTDHFKSSFPPEKRTFPENDVFFTEHAIGPNPTCSVCGTAAAGAGT